jgi:hypothetical protein
VNQVKKKLSDLSKEIDDLMNKIAAKRSANRLIEVKALESKLSTTEDGIVELTRKKNRLSEKIREEELKEEIIKELIRRKELEERERNL